jgi:FkbM family methyltransferase
MVTLALHNTALSIKTFKALKLSPISLTILFLLKLMSFGKTFSRKFAMRYEKFTLKLPLCLVDRSLRYKLLLRPFIYWDVDVIYEQYVMKEYERLRKVLPCDVVVDVGAYIGDFTLYACEKVGKEGMVIAFEPSQEEYEILKRNIKDNVIENCLAFRAGLGDTTREEQPLYSLASAFFYPGAKSLINEQNFGRALNSVISIRRLDDVCKMLGITHVDFLKIDVEGYGLEVLKGAEALLKSGTYIAMEIHLPYEREVSNYLSKLGYKQVASFDSPWGGILYAFRSN